MIIVHKRFYTWKRKGISKLFHRLAMAAYHQIYRHTTMAERFEPGSELDLIIRFFKLRLTPKGRAELALVKQKEAAWWANPKRWPRP